MTVEKVVALVDRAMHAETPPEEARTSAFLAWKLVQKLGLELARPEPPPKRRRHRGRIIVSKFDGICDVCGEAYEAGKKVRWKRHTGCIHLDCQSHWWMDLY